MNAITEYYYAKEREESAVERINDSYLEALNSLEKLEAENAKLRELCADLRFCKRNNCLTCSHGLFCDMRFDERCAELGIEVE